MEQCPTTPFEPSAISELGALEERQRVLLVGRASDSGDHASNLELSGKRAVAIENAIRQAFSMGENSIQTESLGELLGVFPSGPNDPAERRVEIFICENPA